MTTRLRQILFVPPAPLVWAQHLGLFDAAGVDVETTQTTSSDQLGAGLADGTWDLGIAVVDNVVAWNDERRANLRIIAQLERSTIMAFCGLAQFRSLAEAAARPIAVDSTTNGFVLVLYRALARAGIDWRTSPGYTRKGGLYYATLHDYHNTNGGTYSFQRLDVDVIQHIPLLRENWVLVGRASGQTTLNDNDLIPYFLLPALGSGSDLRAFESDRFRDRHSMVMSAEIRWIPAQAVDMALFYDAGKVTPRRSDFSFKQLKSDVGIGIRFHGLIATPLRIDFAVGNEGWKVGFCGSAVF